MVFQDGRHGGYLGFQIRTISASFDLQVAPIRPTKILIKWSLGSGEEAQNRFRPWQPLGFQIGTIFAIFYLSPSCPDTSCKSLIQLAFWFRRRGTK